METARTYYEILDVCETASMEVVRDAFVRRMESLDECSDTCTDGQDQWTQVEEAAGVLLDTGLRYDYDRVLHPDRFTIHYYPMASKLDPYVECRKRDVQTWSERKRNTDPETDEISRALLFLVYGIVIFMLGIRDVQKKEHKPDPKPSSTELTIDIPKIHYGFGKPLTTSTSYDYGVSPEHQDICFTPRHASINADKASGGTEHFEFQISGIDYLRDCTVVHWRYRARSADQQKMLLPVRAFTFKGWRNPTTPNHYEVEALDIPIGADDKVTLEPGGWHDVTARYCPIVGAYHVFFSYLGIKLDCWEGKNPYMLEATRDWQ